MAKKEHLPMPNPPQITPIGPETIEYQTKYTTVTQTPVQFPDGTTGTYARINPTLGGSIIARRIRNGTPEYCLIEQYRFPINQTTLELPGGGVENHTSSEALRELLEETGLTPTNTPPINLGTVHPSGGVLATIGNIWLIEISNDQNETYTEQETGATHHWVTDKQINHLINTNQLTCAITITAFMKLRTSPHHQEPINETTVLTINTKNTNQTNSLTTTINQENNHTQ